jgi:hypothetical protein
MMKYCILVFLFIYPYLPVGHKGSVLDHNILEFHSTPLSTDKGPDYKSAALKFNPEDSFWDFERKVKFQKFKFEKRGDTIYLIRPCNKLKQTPIFTIRKNDTLHNRTPDFMHLPRCSSNEAASSVLINRDSIIKLAGYNFHCYVFKTYKYVSKSVDCNGPPKKYGWQMVFIDKKTLLPLEILNLDEYGINPVYRAFYLYSIKKF